MLNLSVNLNGSNTMKKITLLLLTGLCSQLTAAPALVEQASEAALSESQNSVALRLLEDLEDEKVNSSFFDIDDKYLDEDIHLTPDHHRLIKKMNNPRFFRKPQGRELLDAAIQTEGMTEKDRKKLWHSILQAALLQKWYGQMLVTPDVAKNVRRNLAKPGKVMGIGIGTGAGIGLLTGAAGAAEVGKGRVVVAGLLAGTLFGTLLSGIIALQYNHIRKRAAAGLKGTIYNLATLVNEYGEHMPAHMRDKIVAALEKVDSAKSVTKKSNILQRFYNYARRRSKLTY